MKIDQDFEPVNIDFKDVLWHAERAQAAYEPPEVIKTKFRNTVYVGTDPKIDVQYFIEVFHDTKLQAISVRGTTNLLNFKQDADYIEARERRLGIYVHRGFDRDASTIYRDILPRLRRDYGVSVTGHSLGAAIAALLMIYLHEDGFIIRPSVNFGQPKFTNKRGADKYLFLPLLRVVNENDVVPLLPPATLADSDHGAYVHFKPELILLESQYFSYLVEHDAERRQVSSFWSNLGNESITEHFMQNYLKDIRKKLTHSVQIPYNARERYISLPVMQSGDTL